MANSLLPLDLRWQLTRDVVRHPVHARDLVDNATRDAAGHVVGQLCPVGRQVSKLSTARRVIGHAYVLLAYRHTLATTPG